MNKKLTEDKDIKDFKLVAKIGEIQLIIVSEAEDLAHMLITKLESCVEIKKSDIQIDAKLQNISVFDPSSDTVYKHVSNKYFKLIYSLVQYNLLNTINCFSESKHFILAVSTISIVNFQMKPLFHFLI